MSHYYTPEVNLASHPRRVALTVGGKTLEFMTDAGVFSRRGVDFGSRLLIEALLGAVPPIRGRVLDLGCGYGPIGLSLGALRPGIEPVLCDVNRRALALAGENARALGVPAELLESDGFARIEGFFDHIVTNPPIRAGKSVYYPWFAQAPRFLRAGGCFWCVVQKKQGASSVQAALEQHFGKCLRTSGESGYRVLRAFRESSPAET